MKWSEMPRIELTPAWIGVIIATISILASLVITWGLFGYRLEHLEGRMGCTEDIVSTQSIAQASNIAKLDLIIESLARIEGELDNYVRIETCDAVREGNYD